MTTYEDLTESDRLNLCDIAWFIKGYRSAKPECGLEEDHENTLLRIANAIKNRPKKDEAKPKMVIPTVTTNMLRDGTKV